MTKLITLTALLAVTLLAQSPGTSGLTEAQTAAIASLNAGLASQNEAVNAARAALLNASLSESAMLGARAEALRTAELALADSRAQAFTKVQASADKLTPNQAATFGRGGGRGGQGGGNRSFGTGGTIPNITRAQVDALTGLTNQILPLTRAVTDARAALNAASVAGTPNSPALLAAVGALKSAELQVATTRAAAFAKVQASGNKLAPNQVTAFLALGGSFAGFAFTLPQPINFAEDDGSVAIFDGKTLKGWDGNPKFWRVEDGALIGESTPQNPSGNNYIVYRDIEAKDFTLRFEIKVEGTGGSGFQYRSKTGLPWLASIADNVTANVGPVNLNWMMTGPQADFWPNSPDWTGQFYSENTPMRILAWRGQVVEGSGMARKQLMGNIGDRKQLASLVKMNDWNEFTVIARGGTCMHILNGQLMAVMVDDDPNSSNNQSGFFGIEIEATTKVYVRNIRVKKIN